MRLLLSLVVSAVLLVILPIYVQYIWEQKKTLGWRKVLKHVVPIVAIVSGAFLLTWFGVVSTSAAGARRPPKFEFFTKANLEEEARTRGLFKGQGFGQVLQLLKAKFDDADYAQGKSDFDHALKLYDEMERGADANGSFTTFPSACIKNNMAIAYFRKQGDRGFKASSLLLEALRMAPKPNYQSALIQRNLDALDTYVNQ